MIEEESNREGAGMRTNRAQASEQKERNGEDAKIRMVYSNVDGVCAKNTEIKDLLKEKSPDIVCMTETKFKPDKNRSHVLDWEGYRIWRKDRKDKQGGVVLIAMKQEMRARVI